MFKYSIRMSLQSALQILDLNSVFFNNFNQFMFIIHSLLYLLCSYYCKVV